MTKNILLSTLLFSFFAFYSCSKKDNKPVLTENPTAKAQYDASNLGIYKGVFVGSSGTVIIDISNSGTITATLIVDNVTYNFTTNQTVQVNQQTTINFSSGNNSFTFSVASNGENPTISNLIMNGHANPALFVVKEVSTAIVKCYEGTYAGDDRGVFNAIIYKNKIKALAKSNITNINHIADGTVTNNQINATGTVSTGAIFSGTLSADNFSGTWINAQDVSKGTFAGKRTY